AREFWVCLVRHAGHTVTRDQLIDACWGGRIVSDDAVTRVVAQVRSVARGVEPPPFILETVPNVGFPLAPAHDTEGHGDPGAARSQATRALVSPPAWRRPAVIAGALAAVVLL